MAKAAQALEDALRFVLTDTNLPTQYPDFQALTRDLVRRIAPYAVLVDREVYAQLTKPEVEVSKSLAESTERFRKHIERVEADMQKRESSPPSPGPFTLSIEALTALSKPRNHRIK